APVNAKFREHVVWLEIEVVGNGRIAHVLERMEAREVIEEKARAALQRGDVGDVSLRRLHAFLFGAERRDRAGGASDERRDGGRAQARVPHRLKHGSSLDPVPVWSTRSRSR